MALLAGASHSAAQSLQEEAQAYEERVDRAARMLEGHPRLKNLPHERRRDIVEFVTGNMLFALLHEMGHAHITEMGLPVLGREEDAADSYAVVTILKVGSASSRNLLVHSAEGWFFSAYRGEKEGIALSFYDQHSLDKQRAYQIVCLMVGANPTKFKELADRIHLPENRQDSCVADYSNASWSWENALKPHLRSVDQPKTNISVVYGKGEGDLALFEKTFRAIQMLESVAMLEANEYTWRQPFTIEMQSCGSPNANWDLATRRLTLCYEMAAEFSQLYRGYFDRIALPRYQ